MDITNYIMIEYGHPMHAFDLSKVRGRQIVVRRAHPGETLTTLDGNERALRTDDLVICDQERATGLAGIMGGEESEITEGTTDVMFECAAFDRTAIRLTSRALGMRTESSGRFERGVAAGTVMDALRPRLHAGEPFGRGRRGVRRDRPLSQPAPRAGHHRQRGAHSGARGRGHPRGRYGAHPAQASLRLRARRRHPYRDRPRLP